jgi:hypothetical protein
MVSTFLHLTVLGTVPNLPNVGVRRASQMKDVNVHVYERSGLGLKRISAFDHPVCPESKPIVRVLYCGGVHYGMLFSIVRSNFLGPSRYMHLSVLRRCDRRLNGLPPLD